MNLTSPCSRLLLPYVLGLVLCPTCYSAVSMVDTFDQGGFSMSYPDNSNPSNESVSLPLAQRRIADLNPPPFGSSVTTMTSTLSSSTGKFTLMINGTSSLPHVPLNLDLIYAGGGPYNISGCTDFILGFSELSGVGSLYVELGASSEIAGIHRVDLTGPGDVFFPVTDVRINGGLGLDSFNVLRFIFEARSTEFSFTLDEIRLVPEPSAALLAVAAGAGLLARRRRKSE